MQRPNHSRRMSTQSGNNILETALVLTPVLAMLFGILDFSMAIFVRSTMQSAVREGVRYAVTYQVNGGCQDAAIQQVVKNYAAGLLSSTTNAAKIHTRYYRPNDLTTEVTGAGSNAPGNVVQVSVEGYQWPWIAPLLRPGGSISVTVFAADRMESLPGGAAPPCR